MDGTRVVVICNQCGAFWDPAAEAAPCTDSTHEHSTFDSHLHRTGVVMPDGTEVTAVSFGSADPYAREVTPDFGLNLDGRWRWPTARRGRRLDPGHLLRAGSRDRRAGGVRRQPHLLTAPAVGRLGTWPES